MLDNIFEYFGHKHTRSATIPTPLPSRVHIGLLVDALKSFVEHGTNGRDKSAL